MSYCCRDVGAEEFFHKWYPVFKKIYKEVPSGDLDISFNESSWRMVPMSTDLQRPYGPRDWQKRKRQTYEELNAYDHYIPFYHALEKMGVGEIYFVSCDFITFLDPEAVIVGEENNIIADWVGSGFASSVAPQPRDDGMMPAPYVAFSAEGNWSFYMTLENFGFLCAPPDVLQVFFDYWGGEEELYRRFSDFDLSRSWHYSLGPAHSASMEQASRRQPWRIEGRDETYRLAGWKPPEECYEDWLWCDPRWDDPAWRVSQGVRGPQVSRLGKYVETALRDWDTYLDKLNNENPEARPWAALSRVAPTYDWCYSPEGYTQRSLTQDEVSDLWRPLVQRIYRTLPQGQLDVTFHDPSWRMVPLSTHPRDPYGTRDWLESLIHYREEDRAYNEYFPFYHALRKMGAEEVAFLDCASLLPPDANAAQDVPLGSATNLVFPAEQDCIPGGLYVAVSAEGRWSFHMTRDGFGFLCAGPDVMQHFFDHWGGEEALYQRFTEYDLGGRWAYHLDKARTDPTIDALRRETYRLAGWQAPEMSPEEMQEKWPWRDPRWEDPAWRISKGFYGPQLAGGRYDVDEALQKWDLYLEQRPQP